MKKMFLTILCVLSSFITAQAKFHLFARTKVVEHCLEDVNRGDRLEIANKFGNIEFRIHDENRIKALVNVKVAASNPSDAKRLLDAIDIVAEKKKNWDKTDFLLKNSYDGEVGGQTKIEVNWVVYIPKNKLALKVDNKFGNVNIEEYHLPFEADIKFGNLTAGRLLYKERQKVSVQFGKLMIDEAVAVYAGVRFGEANIGRADYLNFTLQHSEGRVEEADTLVASFKHSKADIISVGSMKVFDVAHSTLNVETLNGRLDIIEGSHSNVGVTVHSAKGFEGVKMNLSFTPVQLFLPRNIKAQCHLSSKMGEIRIDKRLEEHFENLRDDADYGSLPQINISDRFAEITVEPLD